MGGSVSGKLLLTLACLCRGVSYLKVLAGELAQHLLPIASRMQRFASRVMYGVTTDHLKS